MKINDFSLLSNLKSFTIRSVFNKSFQNQKKTQFLLEYK